MEQEENNESSKRDISQKWADDLYESLRELETFEALSKHGCENIIEYANLPANQIQDLGWIQLKNMEYWCDALTRIIIKTEPITTKKKNKELRNKIKAIKHFAKSGMDKKKGEGIDTVGKWIGRDQVNHKKTRRYNLNPLFYRLVERLCGINEEIIKSLKDILWLPKSKDTDGGDD